MENNLLVMMTEHNSLRFKFFNGYATAPVSKYGLTFDHPSKKTVGHNKSTWQATEPMLETGSIVFIDMFLHAFQYRE